MAGAQGYGKETVGPGPFGTGGDLVLARARAVAGRVVRVVFDEEPLHSSAAGINDALNPMNYVISTVSGTAELVTPVWVNPDMLVGPCLVVNAGPERAFDVHLDRQLSELVQYRVTASSITALSGANLGTPFSQDFYGIARLQDVRRPPQPSMADIANSPFGGTWVVDGTGDLAPDGGQASLLKRCFRRITTPLGSYTFLDGYGCALMLKEPMTPANVALYRTNAIAQLKQEPEVADAWVALSIIGTGIVVVKWGVKTITGAVWEGQTFNRLPDGSIVVP